MDSVRGRYNHSLGTELNSGEKRFNSTNLLRFAYLQLNTSNLAPSSPHVNIFMHYVVIVVMKTKVCSVVVVSLSYQPQIMYIVKCKIHSWLEYGYIDSNLCIFIKIYKRARFVLSHSAPATFQKPPFVCLVCALTDWLPYNNSSKDKILLILEKNLLHLHFCFMSNICKHSW